MHGFGEDADGELYALATNTSANGTGGVVYKLASIRLTLQVLGNLLDISWPVAGGRLQAQTNSPGAGIGTSWATVPNSTLTNRVQIPIGPAHGSVFYRLGHSVMDATVQPRRDPHNITVPSLVGLSENRAVGWGQCL